jgi:PAS domain S-box-containing protein
MKVVLLVTEDSALLEDIKCYLPDKYFLIESNEDAYNWIYENGLSRGVVLVDTDQVDALKWLQGAQKRKPDLIYVGVGKDKKQALLLVEYLYDFLPLPSEPWQLEKTLDRAWEKVISNTELPVGQLESQIVANGSSQGDFDFAARPWARVLSDFSRTVSNQLNRDKFLNLFIYAVKELIPVGKLAVLLKDEDSGDFLITAQQGLDPEINRKLRLNATGGIIAWLVTEGQILKRSAGLDLGAPELKAEVIQEMKLLQASICVPLIAQGNLKGVLCLGSKVTGTPFYERELELLYSVCGNIAIALEDISLHERLVNQKIYIESILQRMNSGVVAIDHSQKITTFNQRAGEILNKSPNELINQDLRALVSPLGDMLYETLQRGKEYHKKNLELAETKIPLEVSTYCMMNHTKEVLGSVMIIDDITSRKIAEAERNKAEQITVLNRFVSQLTHEIKNPMVAIQTFAELLPEKFEDEEFRAAFSQTVRQEVKRINELVDQLIAFSSPLSYQYQLTDIHSVIDQAVYLIEEQGGELNGLIRKNISEEFPPVKVDCLNMAKAISYIINFFWQGIQDKDQEISIITNLHEGDSPVDQIHVIVTDNKTRIDFDNPEKIFSPLEISPENTISIGLPVSRKIIEDHGGTLHVLQTNNSPLKFGISLPVGKS